MLGNRFYNQSFRRLIIAFGQVFNNIVIQRTNKTGIGFSADVDTQSNVSKIVKNIDDLEPEDLVKYGLIPEFVGRLPVISNLHELDEDALVRILKEPKNALVNQYSHLFEIDDVEFDSNKLAKALKQTQFKELQKLEKVEGFEEKGKGELFFRKGKIGTWKDEVSTNIINKIEKLFKNEMEELGYL